MSKMTEKLGIYHGNLAGLSKAQFLLNGRFRLYFFMGGFPTVCGNLRNVLFFADLKTTFFYLFINFVAILLKILTFFSPQIVFM